MHKPSWLFWVVSIFAILWSAFGVYDYVMTSTGNEKYLKDFDPKMIAWILEFPLWRKIIWVVGVGSGMLGSIALILRRKAAVILLMISVVMMVGGLVIHDIAMSNGVEMYGQLGLIATAVLMVVQILITWYAARAKRLGYLR
ncbi:hypothetical protein [Hyphococcus sp.]|uniref:hypothetical protein n=1 Tax=Hyphococcus sp. TaxID=2038636 RepID=UPI002088E129|nr:MAG: hypothetical protein DHS20C04_18390 [Marinicaulis sp.]